MVKYEDVTVKLTGEDGNVFSIIAATAREIRKVHGRDAADAFVKEAMGTSSYDEVLCLVMDTVNVE
jgi:hypothetical protein